MAKHDDLMNEIAQEARSSLAGGQRFYISDLCCSVGAIGASFIAAILVGTTNVPLWLVAGIAAMPGMFTALQRVVDLRGRGQWYLSRATRLRILTLMLKHEKINTQEALNQFAEIETEMDKRWIELINTPTGAASFSNAVHAVENKQISNRNIE